MESRWLLALKSHSSWISSRLAALTLKTTEFDGIRIKTTSNPTAARRESLPKDSAKRLEHFRSEWIGFSEARKQRQQLLDEKED